MLCFRTSAGLLVLITLILAVSMFSIVVDMFIYPSNGHAMNKDPSHNGTLVFYYTLLVSQVCSAGAAAFGTILSFRIWRNNFKMDHNLRHLFILWLISTALNGLMSFVLGIFGLVSFREPGEEIMSLYDMFSKYTEDGAFVVSFERYQLENNCCGINGPDDWMLARFRQGGGDLNTMLSGSYDRLMEGPSTGKCHLAPPAIPLGCGRYILDDIYWKKTWFAMSLLLETVLSAVSGALARYCLF